MKDHEAVNRGIHIRRAQKSPRATMETRMALIVAERGLTEKQLAKYFVPYRKGAKPRFIIGGLQKTRTFRRTGFSMATSERTRSSRGARLRKPPSHVQSLAVAAVRPNRGSVKPRHSAAN